MAGKRRLQPRLALLAFEAFQERGLFAADIGAGAVRDVELERPAVDIVLADQFRLIGLIDRGLQMLALPDEFAAHIDVADVRAHREAREQAALDQQMRIVPHDLAVLAGAGLELVGIDHEIARPAVGRFLRHERPFQAGRKPAPPRPRRPEAFISLTIQSRPLSMIALVPSQAPRRRAPSRPQSWRP